MSALVYACFAVATEGSSIAWGSLLPSVCPPLPLPREICVGRSARAAGHTRLTTESACIPTEAPSFPLVAFTLGMTTFYPKSTASSHICPMWIAGLGNNHLSDVAAKKP